MVGASRRDFSDSARASSSTVVGGGQFNKFGHVGPGRVSTHITYGKRFGMSTVGLRAGAGGLEGGVMGKVTGGVNVPIYFRC